MTPKPKDVRQARAFLQSKGIKSADISPRLFAAAREKLSKSFEKVLRLIAHLQMAGQGEGQAPEATRIAEKER